MGAGLSLEVTATCKRRAPAVRQPSAPAFPGLPARFAALCRACGAQIQVGTTIVWCSQAQGWVHEHCAQQSAQHGRDHVHRPGHHAAGRASGALASSARGPHAAGRP